MPDYNVIYNHCNIFGIHQNKMIFKLLIIRKFRQNYFDVYIYNVGVYSYFLNVTFYEYSSVI